MSDGFYFFEACGLRITDSRLEDPHGTRYVAQSKAIQCKEKKKEDNVFIAIVVGCVAGIHSWIHRPEKIYVFLGDQPLATLIHDSIDQSTFTGGDASPESSPP